MSKDFKDVNEIINFYKNNKYITYENWIIITPTKDEIENFSKKNHYHTNEKECAICKSKFLHGLKNTNICRCCKLFIKCDYCGIYFETIKPFYFYEQIENKKYIKAFCSKKCSCTVNGQGNIQKFNEKVKNDPELSKMMYEARSYVGKNFGKKNIYKALESLQNEHKDILIQNGKNVQQWWKNNEDKRLEHNKKAAIKAGKKNKELWSNNKEWRENQLKICLKNLNKFSSFKEIDGLLYFYDLEENNYILWEDYKKKFLKFSILNINFQLNDNFNEFQLIPTFRTQDSDTWERSRTVFEQNLVDLEIGWFVYIKFYIDSEDNVKPLVIGKSGSLLVNSSGSDVSFSTNINDGPARRFLYESNLEWCKTQIAILKCSSEQEALEKENFYQNKFKLFSS